MRDPLTNLYNQATFRDFIGYENERNRGNGGTDFQPVFAQVEAFNLQPAYVVYLTSLEGSSPEIEQLYATLWINFNGNAEAPLVLKETQDE